MPDAVINRTSSLCTHFDWQVLMLNYVKLKKKFSETGFSFLPLTVYLFISKSINCTLQFNFCFSLSSLDATFGEWFLSISLCEYHWKKLLTNDGCERRRSNTMCVCLTDGSWQTTSDMSKSTSHECGKPVNRPSNDCRINRESFKQFSRILVLH